MHRIAANPWVYDQIQRMAGRERIHDFMMTYIAPVRDSACVLDLGGGTGSARHLWPDSCNYICLDNDTMKLIGLAAKHTHSWGLLADGMKIPIKSASVDVVLCVGVSHHLPSDVLIPIVAEVMRILKADGRFIFLDGTWNPEHQIGRIMWKYDRGSTPHTAEELRAILSNAGTVVNWDTFAVYQRYVLGVIAPR